VDTEISTSLSSAERVAIYQTELETAKALEKEADQRVELGTMAPGDATEFRRHVSSLELALAKER
jgi:hypothetical protein